MWWEDIIRGYIFRLWLAIMDVQFSTCTSLIWHVGTYIHFYTYSKTSKFLIIIIIIYHYSFNLSHIFKIYLKYIYSIFGNFTILKSYPICLRRPFFFWLKGQKNQRSNGQSIELLRFSHILNYHINLNIIILSKFTFSCSLF